MIVIQTMGLTMSSNTAWAKDTGENQLTNAYAALSRGDNRQAISILEKELSSHPQEVVAKRYLAYARLRSGQSKEALKLMQKLSRQVSPDSFDWYIYAECYYAQDAESTAVACFEQSLKLNPRYAAARAGLVKALARLGQFSKAREEIQIGFNLSSDQKVREYYDQLKETVANLEKYDQQQRPGEQVGLTQEQMSRPGDKQIIINPGLSTDGY